MNCPKCGFVQEDRADCIKCGVVFAKYFAFRIPESAPSPFNQEPPPITGSTSAEAALSETVLLQEVQQGLRSLQERFHELEFERAERRRLHGEMRTLDERLREGLGQVSAYREAVELHSTKLAELPPAPTMQDFAALKSGLRAIDISSVQRRLEKMENRQDSFLRESGAWARQLETLPALERRLEDLESRIQALAVAKAEVSREETSGRIESAMRVFEDLKISIQNVTLRYSEIGELKKNHLVMQNEVESLKHATENLGKEFTNGTAARISQLDKEVSALKAEARKAYERMELLEAAAVQSQAGRDSDPPNEVAVLREDLAAAGRQLEAERQQTKSELSLLEKTVKESLSTVVEFPEQIKTLTDRLHLLDQRYQALAETLTRFSEANHRIPERTAELGRDVEHLGEACLQTRMQVQVLEDRIAGLNVPSLHESNNPGSGDMHVIRENLDEIRRFMATLSRKL